MPSGRPNAQNASRATVYDRAPVDPRQRWKPRHRPRAGRRARRAQADVPRHGLGSAPGRAHGTAPAPGTDRDVSTHQRARGVADRERGDPASYGLDGPVLSRDGSDALARLAYRAAPALLRGISRG